MALPITTPAFILHDPAYFSGNALDVTIPAPIAPIPSDFEGLPEYVGEVFIAPLLNGYDPAQFNYFPNLYLQASIAPGGGKLQFRLGEVLDLLPQLIAYPPSLDPAKAKIPTYNPYSTIRVRLVCVFRAEFRELARSKAYDFIIVRGRLPRSSTVYSTFFTEFSDGKMPFLTAQPNPAPVVPGQPLWLYRLINWKFTGELILKVAIERGAGLENWPGYASVLFFDYTVLAFPVSMDVLNIPANCTQYHVWLENNASERVSEIRTYVPDRSHYDPPQILVFENGLGGYDSLAFSGDDDRKGTFSGENVRLYPAAHASPLTRQGKDQARERDVEITLRTGYLPSAGWVDYLQSLLLSDDVLLLSDAGYVPLGQATDDIALQSNANRQVSAEVKFRLDAPDRGYFPQ